jgi:hypothetical protein
VRHCICIEKKNQLDATAWFIALIICSACFGHFYVHHQELETMCVLLLPMVCDALVACCWRSGAGQQAMHSGWGMLLLWYDAPTILPAGRLATSWVHYLSKECVYKLVMNCAPVLLCEFFSCKLEWMSCTRECHTQIHTYSKICSFWCFRHLEYCKKEIYS